MARSRKKNPAGGVTTATSNKQAKRLANRILRSRNRQVLREIRDPEKIQFYLMREISNVWDMPKDGTRWYGNWADWEGLDRFMRK